MKKKFKLFKSIHKKYANLNLSTPEQFNRFLRRFFFKYFSKLLLFLATTKLKEKKFEITIKEKLFPSRC